MINIISKRTLLLIVFLAALTVGLIILAVSNPAPQPKKEAINPTPTPFAQSTLTFVEPTLGTQSAQTVNVILQTNSNRVGTVQLELGFDPTAIMVKDITAGPLFPTPVQLTKDINNASGHISYAFGLAPKQQAIQGQGILATITYTKLPSDQTSTQFVFLPKTQVAAVGVPQSVLSSARPYTIQLVSPTPSTIIQPVQTTTMPQ
jgi:hypothetical protein